MKSKNWIIVFIIYTVVIFLCLIASRLLFEQNITSSNLLGYCALSVCTALIPFIGGYLGRRTLFLLSSLSIAIGIIYAFYITVSDAAPGWYDLVSIIGYLFIVGIGVIIAIVADIIVYFVKDRKLRNK